MSKKLVKAKQRKEHKVPKSYDLGGGISNKVDLAKFKLVPIEDIIPNPDNNNKHPEDQIAMLVEQYKFQGFRDPLIISLRNGLLACGEGRLIAAKKAGLTHLPCLYQEFESEAQEYAFITAHNASNRWSDIDYSYVNAKIQELGPDFDTNWLAIKDFGITPEDNDKNSGEAGAVGELAKLSFNVTHEQKDLITRALNKVKYEMTLEDPKNKGEALYELAKQYV